MDKITIYTDGAARGNPGPSASGYSIYMNGRQVAKGERLNGPATNNFAEYNAVILALRWCADNVPSHKECAVDLYSDSELVVRQLGGIYRVKSEDMKKLNKVARGLIKEFKTVKFQNLPREDRNISAVDARLNQLLDRRE